MIKEKSNDLLFLSIILLIVSVILVVFVNPFLVPLVFVSALFFAFVFIYRLTPSKESVEGRKLALKSLTTIGIFILVFIVLVLARVPLIFAVFIAFVVSLITRLRAKRLYKEPTKTGKVENYK